MKDMAGAEIVTGEADMVVKDMAGAEATKEAESAENTIRNEGKGGG